MCVCVCVCVCVCMCVCVCVCIYIYIYIISYMGAQRLAFSAGAELARCLEAVLSDRDVAVERVRDRLSDAHDPDATFGYRSARVFYGRCLAAVLVAV
jgi:Zn-dependent membrane protease YugP